MNEFPFWPMDTGYTHSHAKRSGQVYSQTVTGDPEVDHEVCIVCDD